MKKVIDLIAQWAALISGAFIFIGIFRAILYYFPFHIPIHTYIDLSEVFTIWFPDTIFSMFGPLIFGFFVAFIYSIKPEQKLEFYYYHIVVYLMHIAAIVFLFTDLLFNWYGRHSAEKMAFVYPYWLLLGITAVIGGSFLMGGIFRLVLSLRKPREPTFSNRLRADAICNVCFIMFYLFCYFIYDPLATDITSKRTEERIELVRTDHDKITTNDTLRYLGKTRNYIFLWDKVRNASVVYKADQFTEIRIGRIKSK